MTTMAVAYYIAPLQKYTRMYDVKYHYERII